MAFHPAIGTHPHKRVVMRFLEVAPKNSQRRFWFAVAESLRRSTNTVLPFVPRRQWAAAGEKDSNLNLTQEALKATQNKLLSSGIPPPPYWKTISTAIKGELNRLISSKVTEQPLLSFPFPSSYSPSSVFLNIPLFSLAAEGAGHQWNAIRSQGGLEVTGQKCPVECASAGSLKEKPVCFVLLWSMEGGSQEATLCPFVTALCLTFLRQTVESLFPYVFIWLEQTAYIDFMHVYRRRLRDRDWHAVQHMWNNNHRMGIFSCLKPSAGNQYDAKKRAVNNMSRDVNWKKNKTTQQQTRSKQNREPPDHHHWKHNESP